jgi:hypothetical protein
MITSPNMLFYVFIGNDVNGGYDVFLKFDFLTGDDIIIRSKVFTRMIECDVIDKIYDDIIKYVMIRTSLLTKIKCDF